MEASQLKLLMDYTLFHIGLYATLITALIAVSHFLHKKIGLFGGICLGVMVFWFLVADMAGGRNSQQYSKLRELP